MARLDAGDRTGTTWSGSPHGLLGRDAELAAIREHLSGGAQVATVLGMAGAGKTSFLSAAGRSASDQGWVVVSVQGRKTEAMLGYTTLLDLLDSPETSDPRTAVLAETIRERVMGRADGGAPEALRLRRDVHRWLLGVARAHRLLVTVDDAHWVDPASWLVLAFVANRLGRTPVSFLCASRADVAPAGLEDQPAVHLSPLDQTDALTLLDRSTSTLDPVVRASIVGRAAGNPLALVEFGRISGSTTLGGPAVPASIEAAFATDLPDLPAGTRVLLLLAAAGGVELAVLSQALGTSEPIDELAEPAERAGFVRVRGQRVVFRHPLIESTVYDLASAAERRRAHAVLADLYATDDDRHVWHRASASDRPDETVAVELMASAARAENRGAQQEAVDAVLRAAELTADPELRDERLLIGIGLSNGVGEVHAIATLAEHFRASSSHPLVRARAAHLHAFALTQTMQQTSAQEMLTLSLEELISLDDSAGWGSLTTLATLTYRLCQRRDVLADWLGRYEASTPFDLAGHPLNAAARAFVRAALDPLARPHDLCQLVDSAPEEPPGDLSIYETAAYDILLGATGWLLDEHPTALRRLSRAAERMQRTGVAAPLPQNILALGQVQFDLGHYDEADRSARYLVDLADAYGLLYYRVVGRELRARIATIRGDHREALDAVDALLAEIEPGQAADLEANLIAGRANALIGMRDHEGAYQQLRGLFDSGGAPLHPHVSYRSLGDLVAAANRVGRVEEVAHVVRAAEDHLPDIPGQRMTRVLLRAKAQLADDPAAGQLFERAIHEAGAATWPLEWANAQLDYGVWLRRRKRAADARQYLRSAHQVFTRLGAGSWAAAAEAELRAGGVRLDDNEKPSARWTDLTAQEREIVLLAATGLSNKEIGQTLFLSPRTVGTHLYHAFPKLGVTSRNQLRDVVGELQAP